VTMRRQRVGASWWLLGLLRSYKSRRSQSSECLRHSDLSIDRPRRAAFTFTPNSLARVVTPFIVRLTQRQLAEMKNPELGGAFILSAMAEWNTHLLGLLTQRTRGALHQFRNLGDWQFRL
jgi:hypothetical protein